MKPIKITEKNVTSFGRYNVVILPKRIVKSLKSGIPLTLIAGEYNPSQSRLSYYLLEQPLLNKERKTLKQWIQYTNEEKIIFGAFHDYIRAPSQNNPILMKNIQKELEGCIICSNKFNYFNPKTLETEVTIYPDSNKTKPISKKLIVEVHNDWDNIKEAIENKNNKNDLNLFRFLAQMPNANPTKLIDSIQNLSGKPIEDSDFWTPDKGSRKSDPVRALGLNYYGGDDLFRVDCGGSLGDDGSAFRVAY